MSVFVHAQGIKTVHEGGWSKNGKFLSTQLLNDPLTKNTVGDESRDKGQLISKCTFGVIVF